jgi:hypothetical protein
MILEVLPTATSLALVAQSTVCKSLVFNRIQVGRSANPLCYTHDTNWMEVFLAESDSVCGLRHCCPGIWSPFSTRQKRARMFPNAPGLT